MWQFLINIAKNNNDEKFKIVSAYLWKHKGLCNLEVAQITFWFLISDWELFTLWRYFTVEFCKKNVYLIYQYFIEMHYSYKPYCSYIFTFIIWTMEWKFRLNFPYKEKRKTWKGNITIIMKIGGMVVTLNLNTFKGGKQSLRFFSQ